MGAAIRGTEIQPGLGEGVLKHVELPLAADANNPRECPSITIVVEHLGHQFSGEVYAANPEDREAINRLYRELRFRIGQPLREIGDIEIDL